MISFPAYHKKIKPQRQNADYERTSNYSKDYKMVHDPLVIPVIKSDSSKFISNNRLLHFSQLFYILIPL